MKGANLFWREKEKAGGEKERKESFCVCEGGELRVMV